MNWKPEKLPREQMTERRKYRSSPARKRKPSQARIARQLGVSATAVSVCQRSTTRANLQAGNFLYSVKIMENATISCEDIIAWAKSALKEAEEF